MESRTTEERCAAVDPIAQLPPEIQLTLFEFFTINALGLMQQTSKYYSALLKDETFWLKKHDGSFVPTPYRTDSANQYRAAWLFKRAEVAKTPDKRQIGMIKLNRFLTQHHEPWTNYYRGLLFFEGEGKRKDLGLGFLKLLDGLDTLDYRAAIKIARILLRGRRGEPKLMAQILPLLSPERQQSMFDLILRAHETKTQNLAKLLARLYAHGIVVAANFATTERYFFSLPITADNLAELARLKFDCLPNTLTYEEKAAEIVRYLKSFRSKLPDRPLQSIINYWSAYLALTQGDDDEAIRLLNDTPDFPTANLFLSALFSEHHQNRLAALRLIDIIETNEPEIAPDLLRLQLEVTTPEEAVKTTCELTDCQKIELAEEMSAFYRRVRGRAKLEDPYIVWWLQLAAQAGDAESLELLQSANLQTYPYVALALAIIHEFGILHSEVVDPSHDQAEKYFHLVKDRKYIEEYLQMGIDEKFGCEEAIELLKGKLGQAPRHK